MIRYCRCLLEENAIERLAGIYARNRYNERCNTATEGTTSVQEILTLEERSTSYKAVSPSMVTHSDPKHRLSEETR